MTTTTANFELGHPPAGNLAIPIEEPTPGVNLAGYSPDEVAAEEAPGPDTRGPMEEASEEDFGKWAHRYDDLNGAPDGPDDR